MTDATSSIQFHIGDKPLPSRTHHDAERGAAFLKIGNSYAATVTLGGSHPAAIAETLTGALKLLAESDGITDEQRDEVRMAVERLADDLLKQTLTKAGAR